MGDDMGDEADRTAVVTGGGTGIGRAIARRLAADGFRVVVVGRRKEVLDAVAEEIGGHAVTADLSDPADVERAAAEVVGLLDTVDALVLNAGGANRGPTDTLEELAAHWVGSLRQNLLSAVLLERALRPALRRPGGRIVAISSTSSYGTGGEVAYASVKAALNRWLPTVATRLGPEGITANVLAPGFVPDTELYGPGLPPEQLARYASGIAVGRPGTPEDIAQGVAWLVSPGAEWVTGTELVIHGGKLVAGG
jgi:NAD(P)-dependent dehydrogenase (short-subunit alcohol dehydrogenase family)